MRAADESGAADGGEVGAEGGREADEREGREDDVEIGPFRLDEFGGVAEPAEREVADGNDRQNERNGGGGEPDALRERADGLNVPVSSAVLRDEGPGVADDLEECAGKKSCGHRDGRNRLKRHVRDVSEKEAVDELVDRRHERGGHQRQGSFQEFFQCINYITIEL